MTVKKPKQSEHVTLFKVPEEQFLEPNAFPGTTWYKFPWKACEALPRNNRYPWGVGAIQFSRVDEHEILKIILHLIKLESKHLSSRVTIVHPAPFVPAKWTVVLVIKETPSSQVMFKLPRSSPIIGMDKRPGLSPLNGGGGVPAIS